MESINSADNADRDERLNLPSASGFEADALCLGRQNLLRTLPAETNPEPDEEATRGELIHLAFEKEDPSILESEEDKEIYARGMKTRNDALDQWASEFQLTVIGPANKEIRFWLHWPDTLKPATSARLDAYWVSGEYGFIDELKSLYCSNLTPAERNHQGRLQAVLIAKEHGLKHVRVNFNKAMFGKRDFVDYNEDDLKHAEQSIFQTLWQTKQPEAPRTPGNHCRYCPAKGKFCPESQAWGLLPSVLAENASTIPAKPNDAMIESIVAKMPIENCVLVWDRANVIGKIIDASKKRLKSLPDDELARLGIERSKGRAMRSITDTKACFDELRDAIKMTDEQIWKVMEFGTGKLAKQFQSELGWTKAAADGFIKQLVERHGKTDYAEDGIKRV